MRERCFIAVVGLFLVFLLLGGNLVEAKETVKITDLAGRSLKVPVNPQKIVAIGPGALRMLVYMGLADRIVGVEDFERRWQGGRPYILAHPELRNLPSIGSGGPKGIGAAASPERILALNPDIIFTTFGSWKDVKSVERFQSKVGIPVVIITMGRLEKFEDKDLFKSLRLIGRITRKEKRAEEIISFIRRCVSDLRKRTRDICEGERRKIYVGGIGYRGAHGIFSTQSLYPPFEAVSAMNVAKLSGKKGHLFIDKETLIKWDPDVIFIDEAGIVVFKKDYLREPQFYKSLRAFRDGEVYGVLPFNFYWTNLGTALADAYYIGKVLYPSRFSDVDPVEKADEIYTFLVGKPVYDEMAKQFGGFKRLVQKVAN